MYTVGYIGTDIAVYTFTYY